MSSVSENENCEGTLTGLFHLALSPDHNDAEPAAEALVKRLTRLSSNDTDGTCDESIGNVLPPDAVDMLSTKLDALLRHQLTNRTITNAQGTNLMNLLVEAMSHLTTWIHVGPPDINWAYLMDVVTRVIIALTKETGAAYRSTSLDCAMRILLFAMPRCATEHYWKTLRSNKKLQMSLNIIKWQEFTGTPNPRLMAEELYHTLFIKEDDTTMNEQAYLLDTGGGGSNSKGLTVIYQNPKVHKKNIHRNDENAQQPIHMRNASQPMAACDSVSVKILPNTHGCNIVPDSIRGNPINGDRNTEEKVGGKHERYSSAALLGIKESSFNDDAEQAYPGAEAAGGLFAHDRVETQSGAEDSGAMIQSNDDSLKDCKNALDVINTCHRQERESERGARTESNRERARSEGESTHEVDADHDCPKYALQNKCAVVANDIDMGCNFDTFPVVVSEPTMISGDYLCQYRNTIDHAKDIDQLSASYNKHDAKSDQNNNIAPNFSKNLSDIVNARSESKLFNDSVRGAFEDIVVESHSSSNFDIGQYELIESQLLRDGSAFHNGNSDKQLSLLSSDTKVASSSADHVVTLHCREPGSDEGLGYWRQGVSGEFGATATKELKQISEQWPPSLVLVPTDSENEQYGDVADGDAMAPLDTPRLCLPESYQLGSSDSLFVNPRGSATDLTSDVGTPFTRPFSPSNVSCSKYAREVASSTPAEFNWVLPFSIPSSGSLACADANTPLSAIHCPDRFSSAILDQQSSSMYVNPPSSFIDYRSPVDLSVLPLSKISSLSTDQTLGTLQTSQQGMLEEQRLSNSRSDQMGPACCCRQSASLSQDPFCSLCVNVPDSGLMTASQITLDCGSFTTDSNFIILKNRSPMEKVDSDIGCKHDHTYWKPREEMRVNSAVQAELLGPNRQEKPFEVRYKESESTLAGSGVENSHGDNDFLRLPLDDINDGSDREMPSSLHSRGSSLDSLEYLLSWRGNALKPAGSTLSLAGSFKSYGNDENDRWEDEMHANKGNATSAISLAGSFGSDDTHRDRATVRLMPEAAHFFRTVPADYTNDDDDIINGVKLVEANAGSPNHHGNATVDCAEEQLRDEQPNLATVTDKCFDNFIDFPIEFETFDDLIDPNPHAIYEASAELTCITPDYPQDLIDAEPFVHSISDELLSAVNVVETERDEAIEDEAPQNIMAAASGAITSLELDFAQILDSADEDLTPKVPPTSPTCGVPDIPDPYMHACHATNALQDISHAMDQQDVVPTNNKCASDDISSSIPERILSEFSDYLEGLTAKDIIDIFQQEDNRGVTGATYNESLSTTTLDHCVEKSTVLATCSLEENRPVESHNEKNYVLEVQSCEVTGTRLSNIGDVDGESVSATNYLPSDSSIACLREQACENPEAEIASSSNTDNIDTSVASSAVENDSSVACTEDTTMSAGEYTLDDACVTLSGGPGDGTNTYIAYMNSTSCDAEATHISAAIGKRPDVIPTSDYRLSRLWDLEEDKRLPSLEECSSSPNHPQKGQDDSFNIEISVTNCSGDVVANELVNIPNLDKRIHCRRRIPYQMSLDAPYEPLNTLCDDSNCAQETRSIATAERATENRVEARDIERPIGRHVLCCCFI
ncbi:PREDICTED: uncharacterized protein LOC106807595 [Priapulus caudatus]|uniref:Uncharacterized protein LOC106807595 n=1 Tax=Priapulus caudatus TaxID=37621 RepID=A0ABM1DZV5_PRICU|nr:PREDICTED: uncharacterized protein LOC106807595 [Priapulus caudatus]